jgi:hypothetical protein
VAAFRNDSWQHLKNPHAFLGNPKAVRDGIGILAKPRRVCGPTDDTLKIGGVCYSEKPSVSREIRKIIPTGKHDVGHPGFKKQGMGAFRSGVAKNRRSALETLPVFPIESSNGPKAAVIGQLGRGGGIRKNYWRAARIRFHQTVGNIPE